MSEPFEYDIFVSHSATDKAVVCPLAERLRKDGVKVWFDEWVLKPGDIGQRLKGKNLALKGRNNVCRPFRAGSLLCRKPRALP